MNGLQSQGTGVRRTSNGRRAAWGAALLVALAGAACGKKGSPLPPLIYLPAPVTDFAGRRTGDEVELQFTVPLANTDNSRPADLRRIDVLVYTGRPPDNQTLLKRGVVVASVPVKVPEPVPAEPSEVEEEQPSEEAPDVPESGNPTGVEQGSVATVVDHLTADAFVPMVEPPKRAVPASSSDDTDDHTPIAQPLGGPPTEVPLSRTYMAVGVSWKGRRGPFMPRVEVPLIDPPDAPGTPTIAYTADMITIAWTPPPTARRWMQEPADATTLPTRAVLPVLPASAFNVYEVAPAQVGIPGVAKPSPASFKPLNDSPLALPAFQDGRVEFGKERCYAVRTVDVIGRLRIESPLSQPTCTTLVDTFPPEAPKGLAAVGGAGAINLIWEPNNERDLGGYLLLRGEGAAETLQPITPSPIRETTFRDTTVQAGVQDTYAVVAVDTAQPRNVSGQSNRVQESAR